MASRLLTPSRRSFLRGVGAGALAATAGSPIFTAKAANVSGYKAIVCLFFLGGLDNHDTLFPYDPPSYDSLADIRGSLFSQYASMPGGSTRARERLLPLSPLNAADFGGREFALSEELSGLRALFEQGRAAIVPNVGPLLQPLNRAQWEAGSAPAPSRLFSHNDQQSTWMSSSPEGAQFGWGGRFGDAVVASNANFLPDFTAITSLGNELFLTGDVTRPYQIGLDGADEIFVLDLFEAAPGAGAIVPLLRDHLTAANFQSTNLIERDMAAASESSLTLNELFNQSRRSLVPFSTAFPPGDLGPQLQAIAETISLRAEFQANRQIFFAAIGGFDSHSNQTVDVPSRQQTIDAGISAFVAAMDEIGLSNDVVLFTASDFGRTLAINGDGTDHGWGASHFVVGGGVRGRRIFGEPAPSIFDHDQDSGGGRLIPTTSVEQLAAPIGRWFGLSEGELASALPNLASFSGEPELF